MKKLILISSIFIASIILAFGCGDDDIGPGKSGGSCYEDGTCDYGLSCDIADDRCRASIVLPFDNEKNSCSLDADCDESYRCIEKKCVENEDN